MYRKKYRRQYFILDLKLCTPLHCMCYCNKVFWTLDLICYYQNEYLPIILSFINNFWKHHMRVLYLHYFFLSSIQFSVLKLITSSLFIIITQTHTLSICILYNLLGSFLFIDIELYMYIYNFVYIYVYLCLCQWWIF